MWHLLVQTILFLFVWICSSLIFVSVRIAISIFCSIRNWKMHALFSLCLDEPIPLTLRVATFMVSSMAILVKKRDRHVGGGIEGGEKEISFCKVGRRFVKGRCFV